MTEYNDAYTLMNDKGVQLFGERNRAVDTIGFVENLINSIANRPKSFDADFEEIETSRDTFLNSCDFSQRELQAAREAAGGAGAGLAAGASVAFMAPTAAMWVATTFGTASTGTAISTLSGAAASNAALAWLGGGALSAGGGGVAAGNALLAMAGPIGWTIAGATLLTSILLFTTKKAKLNKQKNEEIEAVKKNTEKVKEMDAEIKQILSETISILNVIKDNARLTYKEIGEQVGVSRVSVKTRMDALQEKGIIKGFQTVIDPTNVPEGIRFFLDVECAPEHYEDVVEYLSKSKMVRQIYSVSGECRIHAAGFANNVRNLEHFSNSIFRSRLGVRRISCHTVLATMMDVDGGVEYVRYQEPEHMEAGGQTPEPEGSGSGY